MVKIILDSGMLDQLSLVGAALELCDDSGRTIGYFHPAPGRPEENPSVRSPFSDEEIQRRRQQRSGRSLAEILERLERSCDTL